MLVMSHDVFEHETVADIEELEGSETTMEYDAEGFNRA